MKNDDYQFGFEKLRVWQLSREFVKQIYRLTENFPKEEKFGLVDQLRRASISIASNIAEGTARASGKDQAHFTNLAYSSLMETINQLYLASDLGFIAESDFIEMKNVVLNIGGKLGALRNAQLSSSCQHNRH